MEILPLRFIHQDDQLFLNEEALKFALAYRLGFPVIDLVAVMPPADQFKKIYKKFSVQDDILAHLLRLEVPTELIEELGRLSKKRDCARLWADLIKTWFYQINQLLGQGQDIESAIKNLPSQNIILFPDGISGTIYLDRDQKNSVIKVEGGKLSTGQLKELDMLVSKLDKELLISHIYHFIVTGDGGSGVIKITRILPFTQHQKNEKESIEIPAMKRTAPLPKTATKILLELGTDFSIEKNIDGVVIKPQNPSYDNLVFSLTESSFALPTLPIILELPDFEDRQNFGTILEAFNFAKNKKGVSNISLAIGAGRSAEQFESVLKELGGQNIWVKVGFPENILNIAELIKPGTLGVVLELDSLTSNLQVSPNKLLDFLENFFLALRQSGIPILASGNIALKGDVLKYLIKKGVWGVSTGKQNALGLAEFLQMFEKDRLLNLPQLD